MKRYLLVAMVTILVLGSNIPLPAVAGCLYQCNIYGELGISGPIDLETSGGTGVSLVTQPSAIRLLQTFEPGTTITLHLHVFYLDGTPVNLTPLTASFAFYSDQAQSTLLTLSDVPVVPEPNAGPGYYLYDFTIPKDWSTGGVSVVALAQSLHDAENNSNAVDTQKAVMSLELVEAKAGFNIGAYIVPIIILILLLIALLLLAARSRKKK